MEEFGKYCASFLFGVLVGAGGKYYADRFTDRRREGEARKETRDEFSKTRGLMPELIAEMKADLSASGKELIRQFYIRNRTLTYGRLDPGFSYYEDEHSDLQSKVHVLENRGYVFDVATGNVPKYRMTEEFVALVLKHG